LPKSFPATEVQTAVRAVPVRWAVVASGGYGRVNLHWRVELDDGRTVFVKQALTDEADIWLRKEREIYEEVRGSFMPQFLGAVEADGRTLLVLEDLSEAEWPPPWTDQRIASVLAALSDLHATAPPASLPILADMRSRVVGWPDVQADPEPLLTTGLCTRAWLAEVLGTFVDAAEKAELAGDELLHFDVRSDNLCFVGERAIFVDWNLACIGNGRFDIAFWLPSLRLEGGPDPWDVLPDAGSLAAAVAGFFAARAGLPAPSGAPTVREFQLRQAAVALPWAARELGLPPPTLPE
jgi:hypothetical protein